MAAQFNKKIRYVADRCRNAYWMLRNGNFKLIFKSIYVELSHRAAIVRSWLQRPMALDDSQVPGSVYVNKRKVVPPSYRPTRSCAPPALESRVDAAVVATQLNQILSSITVAAEDPS
ncbi:MAG: hypothetical protein R3E50_14230 [Halioglobus sp.]